MSHPQRFISIRQLRLAGAFGIAVLTAACGGSSDESSPTPPPAPAASVLSGSVIDGPVRGATVKAFAVTGGVSSETALATATTAADGSYTLSLPAAAYTLVVSATGGKYCAGSSTAQVSDANTCSEGTLTELTTPLITVATVAASATATAHLTPVTTAAAESAAYLQPMSDGVVRLLDGSIDPASFSATYSNLTGGALPGAALADQAGLLATVATMYPGTTLAGAIADIEAGALKGANASVAQANFLIQQGGPPIQDLNGNADDAAATKGSDPTVLVTASSGAKSSTGAAVNAPFFVPRDSIDVDTLKTIMEDASVTDVDPHAPVTVTVGADTYRGYKLADVIVRATKFRPRDGSGLPGAFGVTTAIVAFGAEGRTAAFSFTELIRTANGDKTIVAFEKNGAALPPGEGAMEIIPGNDNDTWLRRVPRLAQLHVRNDFVVTSLTPAAGTPDSVKFQVMGAVVTPTDVTAGTLSTTSSQGYYAVDKIGTKAVGDFPTYYFSQVGPRHMNYWWGQGIRLSDVLDTAKLSYPDDKGACFVVVHSAINVPAVFSCGELYNSSVGVGDGLAGVEARSRRKGVLLVTDDFRLGGGNQVMMTCWGSIDSCTKNDAENPDAYTSNMDGNSDLMNNQFIALVSTEDVVPFQPIKRWFPVSRNADGSQNCGGPNNCIPWIDVGERLQQGIFSIEVIYANGTGNGTRSAGGNAGGGGHHG